MDDDISTIPSKGDRSCARLEQPALGPLDAGRKWR
jgi:hypothetical protein